MLFFDEARARVLSDVGPLSSERVSIDDALGRVVAEDLVARHPLPRFDHSAMDGYALTTADLEGAAPWKLLVVGESRAGATAAPLSPKTAARIFTGAPLPPRADAVVPQENVTREGDAIRVDVLPTRGQHIRREGEDLARGAIAITTGTRLGPGALALAAMLDRSEIVVARRPRVTILCTGSELHAPGDESPPASIPESNSAPLGAFARQAAASVRIAPLVADDARATRLAIERALDGTDVLLTVGGVSVGDHDLVRGALEDAGVTLGFWKVAIKPGKPLVFGKTATAHVLGLPGNPASAIVTFVLFGVPLLRRLQRDVCVFPPPLRARLASARRRPTDRLELVRATLRFEGDALVADAHDNQSSGAVTSLAHSDGIAFIPPGVSPLSAGDYVDFVRWSDA